MGTKKEEHLHDAQGYNAHNQTVLLSSEVVSSKQSCFLEKEGCVKREGSVNVL
jgi:hypothetical protein